MLIDLGVFLARFLSKWIYTPLIILLVQMTLGGIGNYIYPNYFGNAKALSIATLCQSALTLSLSTVIVRSTSRFGKKELGIAGAVIGAITLVFAYLIHTNNVIVWIGLYLVASLGTSLFSLSCWAMITDVIDDTEKLAYCL